MKLELKKRIVKTDLEHGIVCCRNMDVEESGHSTTVIIRNVM